MSSIKLDGLTLASTANSAVNLDSSVNIKPLLNASGSAPIYACRAWVHFDGTGTPAISASGNVSSITDNDVGNHTVNMTTAMPDANYSVLATNELHAFIPSGQTTTSFVVISEAFSGSKTDYDDISAAVFR